MAAIELVHVTKVFGATPAVRDLSLEIAEGEFVVLVGPSGCGKTTALRMVAGLEEITGGDIRIGGRVVNDLAPRDRDIAMVFQNYALYPHKTVYENLVFGLRMRKVPKAEQRRRVEEIAGILGLTDYLQRRPAQLSGGQRQRVAMGRAIVREPKAFLMDEPLSNLDAKLRVQMRAEIARIQRTLGVTTLYVTHDQVEAMTMGSRVAVLRDGVLQQVDAPETIYDSPANLFVASFLGSPQMNLFEGQLAAADGALACRFGSGELDVTTSADAPLRGYAGRAVAVGVRPEDVQVAAGREGPRLRGRVLLTEALGPELLAHVEVEVTPLGRSDLVDSTAQPQLGIESPRSTTLLARLDRHAVHPDETVELALDPHRLHFFDLETGDAIRVVDAPLPAAVAV